MWASVKWAIYHIGLGHDIMWAKDARELRKVRNLSMGIECVI